MSEEKTADNPTSDQGNRPQKKERGFLSWVWFSFFTWYGVITRTEYFIGWLFIWFIYFFIGSVYLRTTLPPFQLGEALASGTGPAAVLWFFKGLLLVNLGAKRLRSADRNPYTASIIFCVALLTNFSSSLGPGNPVGGGFSFLLFIYLLVAPTKHTEYTLPDDQPKGLGGLLLLLFLTLLVHAQTQVKSLI